MHLSSAVKSPWALGLLITSHLFPLAFADYEADLGNSEVVVDFPACVAVYLAADEDPRSRMIGEGQRLTEIRHSLLAELMEKKPKDAVDVMMSCSFAAL